MTPRLREARTIGVALGLVALLFGLANIAGPAFAATATTTTIAVSPSSQARAGTSVTLTATVSPTATGTVQFTDTVSGALSNLGSPVTLSGGVATLATSSLSVARHSLSAVYTPADGTFTGSNADGAPGTIQIVTVLGQAYLSPQSGSNVDAPNVAMYTPTSPAGCPVGSRAFKVSMTGPGVWTSGFLVIPSSTISGSTASFGGGDITGPFQDTFAGISASNSAPLVAGKYDLTLYCTNALGSTYYGAFTTSIWFTSPTAWQSTDPAGSPAPTTTTLTASPVTSAAAGAPVTLTASVSPSVPGTFTFRDTVSAVTTTLGTANVVGGSGTFTSSSFATGGHSFTASFTPQVTGLQATSASLAVPYTVIASGPQATTTSLGVSPTTSAGFGANVTITATLTPSTAVGTVQFSDNGSPLGSVVAVSSGSASLSSTSLAQGSHSFTAAFTPTDSSAYSASTTLAATPYTITAPVPVTTTTSLGVSPALTAVPGATVTITATVTPSNAVGTVQFSDNGSPLSSPVTVSSGTGQLTTTSLALGSHSFTATFTPTNSSAFTTSSTLSATSYSIATATTTTTIGVSPSTSAAPGATVTITATVTPSSAVGSVQFSDNGSSLGSAVAVSGGTAQFVTTSLALGSHSLTAAFTPTDSSAYGASATASPTPYTIATVTQQSTTTALVVGPAGTTTTAIGQSVTLTAMVTPSDAVGSVQFYDGLSTVSSPVTVSAGSATLTWSSFALGSHSLSASFTPTDSAAFTSSTSAAVSHSVITAPVRGTLKPFVTASPLASSGTATDPMSVGTVSTGTPAGCQKLGTGASSVRGVVVGPGAWSSGITIVSTTTAQVSSTADFEVPLADTFAGLASSNSLTIVAGRYDLTLECRQNNGVVGTFASPIWFTDASNWQSTDPASSASVTTTTLAVGPDGWAFVGAPVKLTATLTPLAAVGSVQFTNTSGGSTSNLGAAVAVVNGVATWVTTSLPVGLYTLGAVFHPASGSFLTSTSQGVTYMVRKTDPPLPTAAPTMAGAAVVGSRLTCNTGAWANNPSSYGYAWLLYGAAIAGATESTYVVQPTDAGQLLACRVYATNDGGTVSATSAAIRIAAATPVPVANPTPVAGPKALAAASRAIKPSFISGAAIVGKTLKVNVGTWKPKPTSFHFQWLRNGKAIRGATKGTYRVTKADRRKKLASIVYAIRTRAVTGKLVTKAVLVR